MIIKQVLTDSQIDQLIQYTNIDPEIQKNTSDLDRFKNRQSFDLWKKKNRVIYTLVNEQDNLLGIIWFGEKAMPNTKYPDNFDPSKYKATFSIRIYQEARGKGLARDFMVQTFSEYLSSKEYLCLKSKGIWIIVASDNKVGLKLYEHFGFKTIAKMHPENQEVMIYE